MSIILGGVYTIIIRSEAEVQIWGLVSITLGIIAIILDRSKNVFIRILLSISTILILAMQPLPIYLWFEFHGIGIADASPGSNFIAHWVFSFPHIIVLILCAIAIIQSTYTALKTTFKK